MNCECLNFNLLLLIKKEVFLKRLEGDVYTILDWWILIPFSNKSWAYIAQKIFVFRDFHFWLSTQEWLEWLTFGIYLDAVKIKLPMGRFLWLQRDRPQLVSRKFSHTITSLGLEHSTELIWQIWLLFTT